MKKVRRVVVWLLIVCIFLQFPLMIRAEEPDMDYESLFTQAPQNGLDSPAAIDAFFSNPGHFMRALAYHSGNARYNIRSAINQHMTDSQEEAAYYLIELLATAPYGERLSKSEEDLIDFFLIDHESNRLVAKHSEQKHWPDYKAAILEQMNSDRAAAAENIAAAIVFNNMEFVWNLANESAQVQEQFVSLLGDIEYYYTQLAVIRSLHYLIHSEIDSTIPEYPEYSVYPGIEKEHVELILAILDRLPNVPWPVIAYELDPQELEQWHAAPDYPDMDINYPALIAGILESEGVSAETKKILVNAALLDTGDFIRALAQEKQEVQQLVLQHVANEDTPHETVNALSEIFKIQIKQETFSAPEKKFATMACDHFAVMYGVTLGSLRPISELIEEILSAYMDNKEQLVQLACSICVDPLQFAKALVAVEEQDCTDINYKLKWRVDTQFRQMMLDSVYSAIEAAVNTSGMGAEEMEALIAFLEYQGQTPLAMYPYGQAPEQPDTTPVVTEPVTEPPLPTDVVTRPTVERTDPIELTQETTAPVQVQDDKKPADTEWISTVCIILGLLCISIVVTTSLAKKKKEAPKQPDQEDPKPAIEPQPVIPQPVAADPNVRCPAPLERNVHQQITQALREKYDEYSVNWYSEQNPYGTCRCYGTDGDYHIIFYAGGLRMEISDSCTVGAHIFRFGTSFELYAYCDGVLIDLKTALEQGLVSTKAVENAWKLHEMTS